MLFLYVKIYIFWNRLKRICYRVIQTKRECIDWLNLSRSLLENKVLEQIKMFQAASSAELQT